MENKPLHSCKYCGSDFDPFIESMEARNNRKVAPTDMIVCDKCYSVNIFDHALHLQLITAELVQYLQPIDKGLGVKLFVAMQMLREMLIEQKKKFARLN